MSDTPGEFVACGAVQTLIRMLRGTAVLVLAGVGCLWLSAADVRAAVELPPNVVLVFIDNVGYGDLGCYGNAAVKTPHMDRLAADGVRCTDFYVGSPSCAPSRGAILCGRHPERTGFNYQALRYEHVALSSAAGEGLPREEQIIPQFLKPLGYATAAFGKWNVGFSPGSRPTERGFDEFLGHEGGNIHYYKHLYHGKNDLRRGVEPVEKVEYQVPAKYLALYGSAPDETDQTIRFRAVLTALDDAIGRMLATIDDLDLRKRTLVLYISDNGAFMVKGGGLETQTNAPLRDGGNSTYEGGIRVPALVLWPGHLAPGTVCREMLSTLDVLPLIVATARPETISRLAGKFAAWHAAVANHKQP